MATAMGGGNGQEDGGHKLFPLIVTAQLGVLWFTATATGKPCHVLSTSSGSNAIEGAYAIYSQVARGEVQ